MRGYARKRPRLRAGPERNDAQNWRRPDGFGNLSTHTRVGYFLRLQKRLLGRLCRAHLTPHAKLPEEMGSHDATALSPGSNVRVNLRVLLFNREY